jgi:hypothetical protein
MRSSRMGLAAAAVIAVAVMLSIGLWDKSAQTAYALDQTIAASHSVRSLEIRDFEPGKEGPKDFWVEFDEAGQIRNIRAEMPEWESPDDGARVIVWQEGKAKAWYKKKRSLVTVLERRFADNMLKTVQLYDPKLALERFLELEKAGLVTLKIDDKADPIVVTSTNAPQLKESGYRPDRTVLFVDRATLLLTKTEQYRLAQNGSYELLGWTELHGYNQPIAPALFTLDDVPADVVRIDQTAQEVGLEQGNLSDKEIAVKVVREFYEAVIAKDYAKAGRLVGGAPASYLERMFEDLGIVRIVSIGEPQPHAQPGVGGFMVPCELETEVNGVKYVYKPWGPGVRPVYNQPTRWAIHGGVTQD